MMDVSVVIPTHNQKERLRLVLSGLQAQTFPASRFEVIVVDDGCRDETAEMLEDVSRHIPFKTIHFPSNVGRCKARNRGVAEARGEFVAFLDGDALPHPEWLQSCWDAFERCGPAALLCGFEYSLPDLEHLQDPQVGSLMDKPISSVVREYIRLRLDEMIITEEMVHGDFARIHRRAREGGYPFPELKVMQDQIIELFAQYPDSPLGWIGFSPHNGVVPRSAFEQVGGFDEEIDFSEGWELTYRLQQAGIQPCFVPQARTYHLYHYHDFSDEAKVEAEYAVRRRAIDYMVWKHQDAKLLLLHFWLAGIWPDPFLPEEALLYDLVHFHQCHQEIEEVGLSDLRRIISRHPVWGSSAPTFREACGQQAC